MDAARRDFYASLCFIGLVTAAVLCGLAHDENWRKFLRISIASATYVAALLTVYSLRSRRDGVCARLPFWCFAASAAAAELASGWLRPNVPPGTTLWVAPVAALLLGGVNRLALARWRPLRDSLLSGRGRTRAPQSLRGR
jgi:hypothetical protein